MYDLDHIFSDRRPTPAEANRCHTILNAAKAFAAVVQDNSPSGDDQDAVIRKIREAAMMANAAIALDGRLFAARAVTTFVPGTPAKSR